MVSTIMHSFAMDTIDHHNRPPHMVMGIIGIVSSIALSIIGVPIIFSVVICALSATLFVGGAVGSRGFVAIGYISAIGVLIAGIVMAPIPSLFVAI